MSMTIDVGKSIRIKHHVELEEDDFEKTVEEDIDGTMSSNSEDSIALEQM